MTQDKESSVDSKHSLASDENVKQRERKEPNFQTKVVIRRLPPTMTQDQFLEQIDPVPENDYFYFVKGDMSLGIFAFSRAYISFVHQEDIFIFKDKFDGYVFVDNKGNEYSAVVEFAPFQKIPKKRAKKKDTKCGTIEQDPDYLKFLETLENPEESLLPSAEAYLEEIEARERELKANSNVPKVTTPLIEYLKQRKLERQKMREEKREERKRRDMERKRIREEERRRRKAERDKEKPKDMSDGGGDDSNQAKDQQEASGTDDSQQVDPPILKLLKNPEREKEAKASGLLQSKGTIAKSPRGGGRRDWDRRDRGRQKERAAVTREKERSKRIRENFGKPQGEQPVQSVKGFATKTRAVSSQSQQKSVGEASKEDQDDKSDGAKDPRLDRRIRNKDRPSLEIYRPGMRKMSAQRGSPQKETHSNASTPSPTQPDSEHPT